jgi:hypothetical protein
LAGWYDEYELLIADSSVLFRCFSAGADVTTAMMEGVGERLHIVESVDGEIHDHRSDAEFADGIEAFREAQVHAPVEPSLEVTRSVQKIRDLNRRLGLGGLDIGEYETVLVAEAGREDGIDYLILMGDSDGRKLANQRDLPNVTSYEFVVELVGRGVLTRDQGARVVERIFGAGYDPERYDADLAGWTP